MRPRSPKPETATALNESTIAAGMTSQGREESESVTSSASATFAPSGASDGSQPETTMAPFEPSAGPPIASGFSGFATCAGYTCRGSRP